MNIPFKAKYCTEPYSSFHGGVVLMRCFITSLNKDFSHNIPEALVMDAARDAGKEFVRRLNERGFETPAMPAPEARNLPYGGTCYEQIVFVKPIRDPHHQWVLFTPDATDRMDALLRGKNKIIETEVPE